VSEAAKYQVLPLQNTSFARAIMPRPSATAGQTVFTYSGVLPGMPLGNAPSILNRSYTITADVTVGADGGDGVIVNEGGRWGGFGLYVLKGKPVFDYNGLMLVQFRWEGQQPLSAGRHTIIFAFTSDGPGIARGGTGVLKVDGQEVATLKIPKTIPFLLPADETFDVGLDLRTPVNDADYQVPFAFNGTINKLTFDLGPVRLSMSEQKLMKKMTDMGAE
jgi:arylsulfatase